MARKKAQGSSSVSVARCFNEAQRSISVHKKLVKALCKRLAEDGAMLVLKELAPCLAHLMLVFSRDMHVERVVRFVVSFVTHPVDESDAKLLEEQEQLVEALLSWLLTMTKASEKSVRYRSCQLIAGVLSHLPAHVSLPNNLIQELRAQVSCRLRDKVPQVRAQAARALARFQEGGDDGEFADDEITAAYQQLVAGDRNKEVRKVVLASLAVSTHTLKSIFMHTRDTCDSVRRTAYLVLASKVPMSALSIKQRNDALRRGLRDRMPSVKQAAQVMLKQWYKETQEQLKAASGERPTESETVLSVLDSLDVEAYETECELVVKELLDSNLVNAVSLVRELDASENHTLKRKTEDADGGECLSSACALMWRVLCAAISREAKEQGKAAALTSGTESAVHASQVTHKLDTLEQVLPSSSEGFVSLVDFHVQSKFGLRFVVKQLLLLACECVEFADATSRMLGEVVFKTLASERGNENLFRSKIAGEDEEDYECGLFCQGSNGMWEAALMKFGAKVFGSSRTCMHQLISLAMNRIVPGASAEDLVQGCVLLNTCFETCPSFGCIDSEMIPELAAHVMNACVTHEAVAVRRESIKLLGMFMLHSSCANEGLLAVFTTALKSDHYQVKTQAAKFFLDLAHMNGPKYAQRKFAQDGSISECPVEMLKECLNVDAGASELLSEEEADSDDKKEFRKVVVEGFLKLMTNNSKYGSDYAWTEGEQCDIFTKLAFLNFDKECGSYAPMQQCISVFFDVYSMLHPYTYQIVCASVLPVVKEAVRRELKPRVFGQVVRFMTYLIQRAPAQDAEAVVSTRQKVATSLICEMVAQVSEESVWEEEEEQMKQILPSLVKILLKLDAQSFNRDATKIMGALLSRLPKDDKIFATKDFALVLDAFATGEENTSPALEAQATALYDQYVAMKSGQDTEAVEAEIEEEDDEEAVEEPAQVEEAEDEEAEAEKENEEEAAPEVKVAQVQHKSPPPRRVLRSRNTKA